MKPEMLSVFVCAAAVLGGCSERQAPALSEAPPAGGNSSGGFAPSTPAGAGGGSAGAGASSGGSAGAAGTGGGGSAGASAGGGGIEPGAPFTGMAFTEDWVPRAPEPIVTTRDEWLEGPGEATTVTVDAASELGKISPHLNGNTAPAYTYFYFDPNVLPKLKALDIPIVRYPGGSTANHYHWDGNYPPGQDAGVFDGLPWTKYLQLLSELGAQALLEVNYGYSIYGTLEEATTLAANWVEYCNAEVGANPNGGVDYAAQRAADGYPEPLRVKYWELGNENYGSWEEGYEPNGADYGSKYGAFLDAMRAVDPNIYLAPVGADASACCGANDWFEAAIAHEYAPGQTVGDVAGFWLMHEYFKDTPEPSDPMMSYVSQVQENSAYFDSIVQASTSKQVGSVPYALTEYNSAITFKDRGHDSMQPNELVGALFIGKVLGEMARLKWAMATYWNIGNGWNEPDSNGHMTSDHGMLSIGQGSLADGTPHSQYYPFYIWARVMGDTLVASSSTASDFAVYASKFTEGGIGLWIVNHGAARSATVEFSGFTPSGAMNAWVISGDDLHDENFLFNGAAGPGDYAGVDPAAAEAAPYYRQSVGAPLTVTVPAYSLTGIVIH